MATKSWISGAPAIAQVQDYLFAGTWEASDVITLSIGNVTVSTTAGSTAIATIVSSLVTLWNNLSATIYPQFRKMTATAVTSTTFRLTHGTPGVPFACTLATTETGGGAADAQTIDGSASSAGTESTVCSGPNHWNAAANWDANATPVDTDAVVIENSAQDILYGLPQSSIDLASLTVEPTYTGNIGLPKRNAGGWAEYLEDYLTLGTVTTLNIKGGKRVKIDVGSNACAANVYGTGTSPEQNVPAFLFKGTSSSNSLNVQGGSVGVAFFAGETADLTGGLRVSGSGSVVCGSGVTLSSTTVSQDGGNLDVSSNLSTVNLLGGNFTNRGATTLAALTVNGGTYTCRSSGTITALKVSGKGKADFTADLRARTVSACDLWKGATLKDGGKTVTWTAGVDLNQCSLEDVTLDLGFDIRLTRGAAA